MRRTRVVCAVAAAVLLGSVPAAPVDAVNVSDDALLVTVNPSDDVDTVRADVARVTGVDIADIAVIEELSVIAVPAGARTDGLYSIDGVDRVEVDGVARALPVTPSDPFYGPFQWGIRVTNTDDAWVRTTGTADVRIAVIDTGVDPVSDLDGALDPGFDFVNNDADPADDHGHGTQSAVVIAARGNDGRGVAGVCWTCRIVPVKVLDADGIGAHSTIANGIVWAVDQGADIINMSLGGTASTSVLNNAVAYAVNAGVLVFAAAGNDGSDEANYPAESPGAISVAASDETDARYAWSNYGASQTDIAAPGCNVAQRPDSLYYWYCGTSSAAPFAAGVAGLALSLDPTVSASALSDAIKQTAVANDFTIHGRVDAERLVYTSQALDSAAPTVTFSEPLPNQFLSGTFTATPNPTDDVSIDRVRLYVGTTFAGEAQASPWSIEVDTTQFDAGPQTLKWRVFDRAGNVGIVERTVNFDNAAPTAVFTWPYPNAPVTGIVQVTPDVADDGGVRRTVLYANDVRIGTAWSAPFAVNWDTSTFEEGPVTLKWRVFDQTGKVGVVERIVTVDRTAPTASVSWPNPGRLVRGTIGVRPTTADSNGVLSTALIVNGAIQSWNPGAPSTITFDTSSFSGRTELVVRAVDRAGNVTYSPIRVVFIDNIPATVTFDAPTPSQQVSGVVPVVAQVSDETGVASVSLYADEVFVGTATSAPWTVEWDTSSVGNGSVVLKWVTFDRAGNRSITSRTVTVTNS